MQMIEDLCENLQFQLIKIATYYLVLVLIDLTNQFIKMDPDPRKNLDPSGSGFETLGKTPK